MKNKILPILCLFILLSFLFINNSFAVFNVTSNDEVLSLPDLPLGNEPVCYFFIKYDLNGVLWYNIFASYIEGSYFKMVDSTESTYTIHCFNSSGERVDFYCYGTDDSRITYWYDSFTTSYSTFNSLNISSGAFYSNKNIYCLDGTIFFQGTPVMGTLAPILGKVEMLEPTTREILILVPIMITLIVSYLGLRKGLTLLKTLRKM